MAKSAARMNAAIRSADKANAFKTALRRKTAPCGDSAKYPPFFRGITQCPRRMGLRLQSRAKGLHVDCLHRTPYNQAVAERMTPGANGVNYPGMRVPLGAGEPASPADRSASRRPYCAAMSRLT